ncbi:MAG: uracil permease, partial [Fusobacteriaceae bacterium]|nr:uracil permease [Fusobacteriaceae bacterium]
LTAFMLGMVDLHLLKDASWIGFSPDALTSLTTIPDFSLTSVLAIAPIALVVFIEHIGDITTNGAVVGKDFFKDPGISRTLLGDGIATVAAGFLGGPANTTYGENTGVLAVTKVYDPSILRIAACYAIVLGVIGKFGVMLQTIPVPVMGGISIILFGMIASVGVRTLIDAELNFAHSRNLVIASIIFVLGIAIDNIAVWRTISLSGLAIAAVIGVTLNKILPEDR